jgi:hypothetical protein
MLAGAGAAAWAGSDVVRFESGAQRVALIELYTSEGCSSCPPAETWLGELRGDRGLWREFVPVAFHVNYWDHLGWSDVLAAKTFTQRQYAYSSAWGSSSVYTPCFVRDGAEWRPGDGGKSASRGSRQVAAGTLSVEWDATRETATVVFRPSASAARLAPGRPMEVSVVLLGGGIVRRIGRGENSGRELRHEFVALGLRTATLLPGAEGTLAATLQVRPEVTIVPARRAIAGWITTAGERAPLQAVGGWLP